MSGQHQSGAPKDAEEAAGGLVDVGPGEGPKIPVPFGLDEVLEEKDREIALLWEQVKRLQADYENFRQRQDREKEDFRAYANEGLVTELLPVLDNLERAMSAAGQAQEPPGLLEGVTLVHRQLQEILTKAGLSPIKAAGELFDPALHHAVGKVETRDYPDDAIIEELQRGYFLGSRLLRPALVTVARNQIQKQ